MIVKIGEGWVNFTFEVAIKYVSDIEIKKAKCK